MIRTIVKVGATIVCVCGMAAFDGAHTPAEARQCVWNKAGFELLVEWYRESDLLKDEANPGKLFLKPNVTPVQRDQFPLGQGRCNDTNEEWIALLKAVGSEYIKPGIQAAVGITVGVAGAAVCIAATAGSTCPVVAAGVGGLVTAAGEFIPDPKELADQPGAFAIVKPSTTHWLDVWGTAWDPQTGRGGALQQSGTTQVPQAGSVQQAGSCVGHHHQPAAKLANLGAVSVAGKRQRRRNPHSRR
jgi:hypothetical protein